MSLTCSCHLRPSTPTAMFPLRTDVVGDCVKWIDSASEKGARVRPVRAGAKASSPADVILARIRLPLLAPTAT